MTCFNSHSTHENAIKMLYNQQHDNLNDPTWQLKKHLSTHEKKSTVPFTSVSLLFRFL